MSATLTEEQLPEAAGPGPGASSRRRHGRGRVADRLPLRERLYPAMPDDGWWGWGGPVLITLFAGVMRFWNLGQPRVFSFDETYYVKDALSLWRYHYEQSSVGNANDLILSGNTDVFTGKASFIVHPPVGKWVIGLGEHLFGVTPFGWRFMPAVLGTAMVLMLCRIVRRMTRSTLLGCLAGLLLAVDGLAIVMSRTALLDGTLAFFVLAAFGALLLDRDRARRRLADWAEARGVLTPMPSGDAGPRLGWRPWRLGAGLLLGLACATKWSGIWFVVAFGLMTVLWDMGGRRAVGIRWPFASMVARDSWGAFLSIVPVSIAVYVASWIPWMRAYSHMQLDGWGLNPRGPTFLPQSFRALLDYHSQMLYFHTHLTDPHPYAAKAAGWLLQVRPTAFWSLNDVKNGTDGCTATTCVREVTSIGTPLLWWAATAALVWLVWRWVGARDWRAGAVLGAVVAGWLPWVILYRDRTIFTFYAVAFVPFMVIALVLLLGQILGSRETVSATRRTWGAAVVGGYVLLVVANTAWLWPLLVGDTLPYASWLRRLWFRGWI
ncbi:MAG: dolichyl-phosphate-mannose--protein mannosyltransferase [Actinomycetes bacterium]